MPRQSTVHYVLAVTVTLLVLTTEVRGARLPLPPPGMVRQSRQYPVVARRTSDIFNMAADIMANHDFRQCMQREVERRRIRQIAALRGLNTVDSFMREAMQHCLNI